MKKNLRFFTEDAIYFFKAEGNQENFCKNMREHPNSIEWIDDFYGKQATIASGYDFDFEFKPFDKDSKVEDYENAIGLYELFQENNIGPAVIYNEKFLTGFIFTFGYEYFMNVIGADKTSHVFATLFFENDVHRSVARNTIGKLYRYVEMTVDKDAEDPYWLTKYAFNNPSLFRIKYYTSKDGENTHKAYFKAFKEWSDETGKKPSYDLATQARCHLSVLSNISDTDLMNEKQLIKYLKDFYKDILFLCNKKG